MHIAEEKIKPYHWLMFAVCFLGTAFAGMASTLMSVYLPVVVKDLPDTESAGSHISAYINSISIAGAAVGGFLIGWISDGWGRKPGVIISITLYSLFTILTGQMPGWWEVLICRFFCGMGIGGILVTGTTMVVEEWPEKTKAILVGILSISFPIGIFSAGAIDYFVSSWREAFLVGIIPLAISFLSWWTLKESAKWTRDRNQHDWHAPKPESLFDSIYGKDLLTASVIFGTMLIGLWALFSWMPTWVSSIVVGDSQEQRGLSMMLLGTGGLAGGFASGWLINAWGPKRSLMLCFGLCTICSFLLFKTNSSFSPVVYAEIVVLALSFGASQGVLSVYIPGLFPVAVRGAATGFCFNTGRILTALAVLFIGVLECSLGGFSNALFIFSLVFVIGLIPSLFVNEIH